MAKKGKYKSELQELREKNVYQIQDFEAPKGEEKRYTRSMHYMKFHPNYIKLKPNSKVLLEYMKDWAFASEEFARLHTFDFSTTMLEKHKIMTSKTTGNALKELEHYGFIRKENNATKTSGITQKWSFSSEWYDGIKRTF